MYKSTFIAPLAGEFNLCSHDIHYGPVIKYGSTSKTNILRSSYTMSTKILGEGN